ncbi:hypothetical protein NCAS_0A05800 [Naumovozyma castellii]|uniref:Reverse transcriptase Ty1/copia-type domain-containing protein n=1 Tax=Naumovozyma castellii TaxID=27288 RepID=G0V6P2_NAUCA|nr:hypothetical protein NCAS_0A05800 [Naumovozyma castellii CBS 4309]CCC67138.1 hypothetical protein NCAS_0A05800 [Naumovozyma castellii CBS 4309]
MNLNKSLYGLKQSGANWYDNIKNYLIKDCGLKGIKGWPRVFKNDDVTICLFVDDMIMFTKEFKYANQIIDCLKKSYDTKIIMDGNSKINELVEYDILGLEIEYTRGRKMLCGMEKSLTEKIPSLNTPLNTAGRKINAPYQPGFKIEDKDIDMNETEYNTRVKKMQKLIGLASYVGYKFRFDLLYYINVLAQHTLYPTYQVLDLTHQLIQYMWDTRDQKLKWKKKSKKVNRLVAITDASFAGQELYKSQLGIFYSLNGKIIGARSTKIKLTCVSSTEAEIYGVSESVPLVNSLEQLISETDNKTCKKSILTDSSPTVSIV